MPSLGGSGSYGGDDPTGGYSGGYGGGGSDGSDRIKQQIEEERIRAEAEKAAREKQIKAEAEEKVRQEAIQKEAEQRKAELMKAAEEFRAKEAVIARSMGQQSVSKDSPIPEFGIEQQLNDMIAAREGKIDTAGKWGGFLGSFLGKAGSQGGEAFLEYLAGKIPEPTRQMAIDAINNGADPQAVKEAIERDYSGSGGGGGSGSGGSVEATGGVGSPGTAGPAGATAGGATNYDPTTYEFWDSFVDEWMGKTGKSVKEQILEDDAFRKEKLEPAFGSYQQLLADLSNQAKTGTGQFAPTTFGMGDFRSSFVPRSQLMTADNLLKYGKEGLTSDLAATDILQPNRGSREFMDKLREIAKWQYGIDLNAQLSREGHANAIAYKEATPGQPDDQGTWLDAIKDIVQIGDTVGDTISRFWK